MRLAFSTLGCPEMTVDAAISHAAQGHWDGLELRSGVGLTVDPTWSSHRRAGVRRRFVDSGVVPLSLASYLRLCDYSVTAAQFRAAAHAQLDLARDLGAGWVRVFPGGPMGEVDATDDAVGRTRLGGLIEMGAAAGVRVAVETHDSHPRVSDVLRLAGRAEGIGIIWDILHPWRSGETPEASAAQLAARSPDVTVPVVQVKDVASLLDLAPLPLGQGRVPIGRCLNLARAFDLTQWVSWEYERAWHPMAPSLPSLSADARALLAELSATAQDRARPPALPALPGARRP